MKKTFRNAREFLNAFERWCRGHGYTPPYLHVSDPIKNDRDLAAAFTGQHHAYSRLPGHPDHTKLERWLARFEGGARFRVRSDGMGAISMALHGARAVRGSHAVLILPLYGGTTDLAEFLHQIYGVQFEFTYLSVWDADLLNKLERAIFERTALVLFEDEGNPTLSIPDIEGIVDVCKGHPRGRPISMCDDTFLFGLLKPFRWGVDVIGNSGTKYVVNESAFPLGCLGVSGPFFDECPAFWAEANRWANLNGGTLGPFEAWLTGTFSPRNTLARLKRHSENAMAVARFLENHPCVERVLYPGLSSHPHHERALKYLEFIGGKQFFGGMISFSIKGDGDAAKRFLYHLTRTSHIPFKASLGGRDDMIESAYLLSHKNLNPHDKKLTGITPSLIRLSVGRIRPVEETIQALDHSLTRIVRKKMSAKKN